MRERLLRRQHLLRNSQCSDIPGGSCSQAGSVGTCTCSKDCGNKGCRLFYVDGDGDGHAAETALPVGGAVSPTIFCVGDTVPVGAADKRDDCNDADGRAFPGQTSSFDTPATGGGYDFDCDGVETPLYPVHAKRRGCVLCNLDESDRVPVCAASTTCDKTNNGQRAALDCRLASVKGGGYACTLDDVSGFIQNVACGSPGPYVTCGACSGLTGTITSSQDDTKKQACK